MKTKAQSDREYYLKNKEAIKEYQKKYKKENASKVKDYFAKYNTKNKKTLKEYKAQWFQKNKSKLDKIRKEYAKNYRKNNAGLINANTAKRRSSKLRATPLWADLEKVKILYEKAKWLSNLMGKQFHVDHVYPLKGKNVCGLHVWENLQLLEAELNIKKNNRT